MTTIYALVGGGVALIPAYIAGAAGWHRLVDWADEHTQHPGTAPFGGRPQLAIEAAPEPPAREPVAAITARPHIEQVCPLDACPLDLGELEDAVLFDADRYALIGATA